MGLLSVKNKITAMTSSHLGRIAAFVALANLLVIGLVALSLESSFKQYHDRAAVTSRNTNNLVSQGLAAEIDRIDLGLLVIVDEIERQSRQGGIDKASLNAFLARQQERLPMADSLHVTNAKGDIAYGVDEMPQPNITLADRDYFTALRQTPELGLVISQPVLGKISHKWVLIFSRRFNTADGGFAGVVNTAVTIDWFRQKFRDLEVGRNGVVVMRGDASRNFDMLARYPLAGFVGQKTVSDTFREQIAGNPKNGTYEARAGADNILRTFSYQSVGNYPLVTLVGLSIDDYLDAWWREVAKMSVLTVIFALVTTAGGRAMLLSWQALEQKSADLARSNADLAQFAYVASHDLQTPLRSIVSYTQLLSRRYRTQLDADADQFIDFIVDGAKHMSTLISDLLIYAGVSTADQSMGPVSANQALNAALAHLQTTIDGSKAKIAAAELPDVIGNTLQLTNLFENLIENALRFQHSGRAPEISIGATPDGPDMWRFFIRDNGIGIDKEYYDKVFVIFQRLDPARFPGGTGIGLAICRSIVARCGGKIWIESIPDQGTTIFFTLPARPTHPVDHALLPIALS